MQPLPHLKRAALALVSLAAITVVAVLATQVPYSAAPSAGGTPKDKPVQGSPLRNAYFDNLHVHTSWSKDGYNLGVRATPDDAYLFAEGEAIRLNLTGELVQLKKPLDFMGVTEHAEYQGIMNKLTDPKSPPCSTPRFPSS
jgi:hypothetical protein